MDPAIIEAREKLAARFSGVRVGGKGSVRRKKKARHVSNATDDKKLQSMLKRLGCNAIPEIEEVNLFKDDGNIIHFTNPKVQASIAANTYVISGRAEEKTMQELLPGIINQLGPDNLQHLKALAPSMAAPAAAAEAEGDDEVPDLVESFEEAEASAE